MRGRRVTSLDDEVLYHAALASASGLTGEAALLAALDATRTGRMSDIVATLQAEQDAIIRSAPSGSVLSRVCRIPAASSVNRPRCKLAALSSNTVG